jgi:hypothetical protein
LKTPSSRRLGWESVHDGLRVRVNGMTTSSVVCEYKCLITSFVFGIVDILGLAAPKWFFSSQSLHFVNKYLVSFIFHI